ncbi:pyridoxal-phosphate dependent enzyme [Acuticoccus mangrovi]|uniref:Pyridoxal-phosphate dependent enzyme n=1 Tax=Acuticoccus mangrovi TaxID=2796142 RepID=A0A934MDQ7_9HYPH|nr:pyridoxal-phosphate dependent enzyme [Acuticoccus mangrovi]MBJ3776637.1 pyridoxal-phosphate dependent enzyme [Acuticoccus mangrovi]
MATVVGFDCLRCGARYGLDAYAQDCPRCHAEAPSNLVVAYAEDPAAALRRPTGNGGGLWRYGDVLPVAPADAVSLAEGSTPLVALERIAAATGVATLLGKDETRNPTGSFKDRLAAIAVAYARSIGAPAIVSSSTGNAGAAVAAYAARAGLPAIVFTAEGAVGPLLTQMKAYGAKVVAVPTKAGRWPLMRYGVERFGFFPTSPFFAPVVGSNPVGIEGYKTLAYEVVEQLDWQVPDVCVLPVCYGDALIGMWRGFLDLKAAGWIDRLPRMMAAEIYGSLGAALASGSDALPDMPQTHATVAKSTTATQSTYQALHALRASGGTAVSVGNDDIMDWQARLASAEGLYVEPAAAGSIAAVAALRRAGAIGDGERVVALLTAGGLKDPDATAARQGEVIPVPLEPEAAFAKLAEAGVLP